MTRSIKALIVLGVAIFVLLVVLVVLLGGLYVRPAQPPTRVADKASSLEPSVPVALSASAEVPVAPAGAALERVRQAGRLRVLMDTGMPPWSGSPPTFVVNEQGKPDGFDHVVALQIARSMGVPEVEVVHALYSELTDRLTKSTDADLFISGFIPDGAAGVSWSEPYLELGLCLIVKSDSGIRTVNDLFGKAVGVYDDEAAKESVSKLVKGYTELVALENGYLDQLLLGRFAGFIYDQPYAVAEIKEFYARNPHRKGSLTIAQYNLTDEVYAVGVREGEADLLAAVNRGIAAFRSSPAYKEALRAWLRGDEVAQAPQAGGRTREVMSGDTLSRIAEKELGRADRWTEIWAMNKSRFPNPDLVEVGDILAMPGS